MPLALLWEHVAPIHGLEHFVHLINIQDYFCREDPKSSIAQGGGEGCSCFAHCRFVNIDHAPLGKRGTALGDRVDKITKRTGPDRTGP